MPFGKYLIMLLGKYLVILFNVILKQDILFRQKEFHGKPDTK